MNRKKTIDYTVTRRPRERDSYGVSSSKSRSDSTGRDLRDRGDGDSRNKTPFWSKDDNNLGSELNLNTLQMLDNLKETIPGGHYDRMQDAARSDFQGELSNTILARNVKDDSLFGRVSGSSYTTDGSRGPIIDEFSEDAFSLHSNPKSKSMDSRDGKDRQRRRTDNSPGRKRSYSPTDNKSSSYRRSREDTPTKHSRSTDLKSGSLRKNDDDDLRSVLKKFQKSKWDDDDDVGVSDKIYDTKQDRKRRKEGTGISSSHDMFTMSSQGTLVSLPLEPLSDTRDYFDTGFSRDYRDDDRQKGKKRSYADNGKEKDRDYSRTRYQSSKQGGQGSYDNGPRGISSDMDSRDSRYGKNKHGGLNDGSLEPLLDPYGDSSSLKMSRLSSDALRDLPLSELAQKSSQKYKTGFELGRPFFGFHSEGQNKEEGWQDPIFDGISKSVDIWKTSSDSERDHRVETYGSIDDNNRDVKQMQNDRLGEYSPIHTFSKSKAGQRDMPGNSLSYKDNNNGGSRLKGNLKTASQPFKSSASKSHTVFSKNNSKDPTATTQKKTGPKPLFPLGFLPRQLQKPVGKNVHKVEVDKGLDEPPLLPRKSGYYPKNTEISRSRSRSSERGDVLIDLGSNNSKTKREVRLPSKGQFTTQNWSGLESNGNRKQSVERDGSKEDHKQAVTKGDMPTKSNRGRGGFKPFGRGNLNTKNNRGRGTAFNQRGRGRGARGRGARGREIGVGIRGRGTMTFRGRGFVPRGRGRGVAHPPVGTTVRNIFRRSASLSPVRSKNRRSSRSPDGQRSRSERQKERSRRSRSRSRSSSFCSTCSSHSCSTCSSWQNISLDNLSEKGERGIKKHHKTGSFSKEKKEKNTTKSVEKLKSDIQVMEKQLEQKSVRAVVDKKKTDPKGKFDLETAKGEPKVGIKEEKKDVKTKEKQRSERNTLAVKEEKGSKEQKGKYSKDVKKELKKKTENAREVILKGEKRRETPRVIKKEKDSPVREVKIVNEKKSKGDKVLDEKSGSKMKVDTLKITIDQAEKRSDTKKDKRSSKGEEKSILDVGKRASKSPPGKQKKKEKEKVKAKKAKKKAKKKKYDRDSGDSGDESVYSSISGQDELSTYRPPEALRDERIVEFSSSQGFDSNRIAEVSVKRENAGGHVTTHKYLEGQASKTHPSRKNLIAIPMSKEPDIPQKRMIPPNGRVPWPNEQQHSYPLSKGGRDGTSSNAPYSEIAFPGEGEFEKINWEKSNLDGGYHAESNLGDQEYSSLHQESEIQSQEWPSEQEGGGDPNNYYYEEGTEGEGYEQEYYSYDQESEWQTGDQGDYQEWCEAEYPQEGTEGEAVAGYEGEYYLGEDGLYYSVEGQGYQEYQGEYVEGGTEGQSLDPEQGGTYAEGDYQYQYSEEGGEWQQYDDAVVYQTEEGWSQAEGEGQWQEEYHEGYYEAESEWGAEYTQGGEYDVSAQEYAAEGTEPLPQEGYSGGEGYDQQLAPEQYYMESVPAQEEGHHVEHGLEPQQQEEPVTSAYYDEEPLALKDDYKNMPVTPSKDKVQASKPLKSILKKSKHLDGNDNGTKLVSERLAQMKKQSKQTVEIPKQSSASASPVQSVQSVEKQEGNADQTTAANAQSEAERYREMEEAILSSQPKDAIGTEYVVRVHESGTANFYCKLCQCYFNTLTAKNLHVKGMKHIELYIRLKSSLLQSVIKDTKVETTTKRPAEEDPSAAQKFPRRF